MQCIARRVVTQSVGNGAKSLSVALLNITSRITLSGRDLCLVNK